MHHTNSEHQLIAMLLTEATGEKHVQWKSASVQMMEHAAKTKESRLMTASFTMIVISILAVICFSIWLNVEMGQRFRTIWSSGMDCKQN